VKETSNERNIGLTEEEAMGLIDIVMLSPMDLTPEQRTAVLKLSEFCRERIREASNAGVVSSAAHSSLNSSFAA